ncbi:hypothetical protein ACIOTI_11675 [Streptomyces sp. NPDC087843]|uniref:hypothetical protein n=1 Tax=Streptomyces sp. NPDC087843 TaxID=3365804 RepID=UPI00380F2D21
MDHNLSGLSTREFEHVSQALAQAILGPGVSVFGDGRDGGREATFEGRVPYPSELDAWDGYGVVQAKFRQRTDQQPQDAVSWLKGQVKEELEAWLSPASKRERLPEYLIFTTNVILTPVPGSGGIAQIEQFVSTYAACLGLKGWAVWSYDQLCRYLDRYDSIRVPMLVPSPLVTSSRSCATPCPPDTSPGQMPSPMRPVPRNTAVRHD